MPRKPRTVAKAPAPAAEPAAPKRRGRKPGSKNKVPSKRGRKPGKASVNVFEAIEKELKAMAAALVKAKKAAAKQIAKAEAAAAKAIVKAEEKAERKIERLKNKLKAKKRKPGRPAKRGRKPGRPRAPKPAARRGRPPKNRHRGGRPRKGQPTKKSMIIDFMTELGKPIKSGDLITALFEKSGERDKKRFAQGIYTTLTQIYKSGELKNADGVISLNK